MRKIILSILGVLLIVSSVYIAKTLIANKKRPKPVASKIVKTVFLDTVKNITVPLYISANGNVKAKQRVELYSEVQGIFRSGNKLFKPGQAYRKGEVLISIDANEYYANVQSAKSSLYNSISSVMPDLRLDYPESYQKWQDYLTQFDLDKPTAELPKMTPGKENYFISGRGIVSNYFTVKNLEQRLSKYLIKAPFSGVLTEGLVTEGTLIRNGQKLGEFINPSVYEIEVSISKSFTDLLKLGKTVQLTNLEKTENYTGKVTRVNGSVDPATQTISVFIEVKDANLKEGIYLEAHLDAKKIENAIEVDRKLLIDNKELFVLKDSVLGTIPAVPVYFSDSKVILKNIPDGTIILEKPVPGAYAGMLVKPYDESSKTKVK